ncbi:C6 finger domain-containing protein [Histoplasma capsulatum G186AR]|uniref:C6 finger domain-containing protein n=1 Tax=Ajellomyces capsulatus TaxID=5037 RepID=A0A8H7YQQ3_AJECA|nr:C6 finger domain-containing protein [Histoplasma capsulatum]QSS73910.1 C6 finger domain-containing protein [Histoplasma capsulatum G186AR]
MASPAKSAPEEQPVARVPSVAGKNKTRAKQSCIPCRTRKVKCDRIKPCHSCCVRGLPSECEYVASNEDRFLITQADAVASLRKEVGMLKQQLAALGHVPRSELDAADKDLSQTSKKPSLKRPQPSPSDHEHSLANSVPYEKHATLMRIFETIATAPEDIVAKTVAQIRKGTLLDDSSAPLSCSSKHPFSYVESQSSSPESSFSDPQSGAQVDDEEYRQFKKHNPGLKRESVDRASTGEFSTSHPPNTPGSLVVRRKSECGDACLNTLNTPESNKATNGSQPSHESEVPSQGHHASQNRGRNECSIMTTVSPKNFLMEGFLNHFLDDFSPNVDGKTIGTSQTIRAAAGIRMFSPVLSDAFKAVALTYFGHEVADQRIERTGSQIHVSVLRKLQEAINNMHQSNSQGILLTVCLLMCFETFRRTTSESLVSHAYGALKLLEYRGPQSHMFGLDHYCFAELRPYWVAITLIIRKPTFLAKEEWKTIPFSAGSSSKDMMHHLLDQVVDIPSYLAQFDRFMEGINSGCLSNSEVAATQRMLWSWVSDLDQRLRQWKKDWFDSVPSRQPTEVTKQGDDPFPVFRCRDPTTMDLITPTTFVYPDLRIAHTICVYYASHLVLSASDTRPSASLQPSQQYEFACNICRSMEYFIRKAPGNLVNRMAFPLRVAFDVVMESSVERQFIIDIFRLVNDRNKLKLWGTTIPEISSKNRLR